MGVKKFKNLFKSGSSSSSSKISNPKEISMSEPARQIDHDKSKTNIADKASVKQLKKAITKKLENPEGAKKAAQIIEELLKNSK